MGLAKHTNDPQVLYNAKMEIIKELMDLDISPELYTQMNPNANTILKNGLAGTNPRVCFFTYSKISNRTGFLGSTT